MESTTCRVAGFFLCFGFVLLGFFSQKNPAIVPEVLQRFPVPALEIKKYLDNHLPCGIEQ